MEVNGGEYNISIVIPAISVNRGISAKPQFCFVTAL